MPATINDPHFTPAAPALSAVLAALDEAGGWLPFDRFMALALYSPRGGYYAGGAGGIVGRGPLDGSDFVTAPELSPLFGATLARQVAQALQASGTAAVWEFGAGSGALAAQVLAALDAQGRADVAYHIVEVSGALRARQQRRLAPWAARVRWHERLPAVIEGVVLGNEVLDAMPVTLLQRAGGLWHERGVAWDAASGRLVWQDRPTDLRPPCAIDGAHDYLTEIHPHAEAFVRTLAQHLRRGVALFLDYGFPEHEYYHPQRAQGTLRCHRAHRADDDPLTDVGAKDITAHVNFTGIALAAQEAGLEVLGYTSQGRFLLNAGLAALLQEASIAERAMAARLVHEHEMGELFKVLMLAPPASAAGWVPIGFAAGDRTHTL
ncbi:putative S-adenosyl-L-methionine-dependent methyltransferase [Tepidimonas sediminis]|uniref:Putative S-adenosyl-L-methionine-dependent methyltransferase n=1 Tax=Tepidimonas sediminis TaxID=2588941 RepID=A0A554WPX3_9BURK|nr:SAM-dependent methyltransferase [Tepidimonas sediminis]TSE25604.1 putative S-adenosyl-L-methionine-dependent methyltransferase [Tepidimonas sediminis]